MADKTITQQLKKLFNEAVSVKSLTPEAKEKLWQQLLLLSDEQTQAIITILQQEQEKIEAMQQELAQADQEVSTLVKKVKKAGIELKKAFFTLEEEASVEHESQETDALLAQLK